MTTRLLLYLAHAIDHLALLIFATAVSAIALDFGVARWEDLMPYATGAFVMFGVASLPAGRYGDLWGRRAMMLVFYFGMGVSLLKKGLGLEFINARPMYVICTNVAFYKFFEFLFIGIYSLIN